ncbi:MAG: hypothetical protein WCQ21_36835 [Verrucomicrobiota bacterium]
MTYGNGLWVAVGKAGPTEAVYTIQYSSNGSDWYAANSGGFSNQYNGYGKGISYGNGLWMAVGMADSYLKPA